MSVLIRFQINGGSFTGASYEQVAKALADIGRGDGSTYPEFSVWGNPAYPKSTVIEYHRSDSFADALDRVNRAIDRADVRQYCTGGDLHVCLDAF